jgi:hypothetical protein
LCIRASRFHANNAVADEQTAFYSANRSKILLIPAYPKGMLSIPKKYTPHVLFLLHIRKRLRKVTVMKIKTERRNSFRAVRLMDGDRQICAALCDHNGCGLPGWASRFIWGSGAGTRGGFTAYLAWRSGSNLWQVRHRGAKRRLIEAGLTRNANIVPGTTH